MFSKYIPSFEVGYIVFLTTVINFLLVMMILLITSRDGDFSSVDFDNYMKKEAVRGYAEVHCDALRQYEFLFKESQGMKK